MQVAFRADASDRIGTGHVIRCLTLARALKRRGAECCFLQRLHEGHLVNMVTQHGFQSIELPVSPPAKHPVGDEDYPAWLGVSQTVDARRCQEQMVGMHPDWLVVDHYGLDAEWEGAMRGKVGSILVIDDLANRSHDCEFLVDQNDYLEGSHRYQSLVPDNGRVLAGPRYALLSERYRRNRPDCALTSHRIRHVLVYYGGVDPTNETARALRVLSTREFAELQVEVIIGVNNPHRDEIERLVSQRPNTRLLGQQNDLVDRMLAADLALGAGGTTTWERCCLGLPSLVTTIAANQVPYNRELAEKGLIQYAGHTTSLTDKVLASRLWPLVYEDGVASEIAQRSWRLVDGWGAIRIAEHIMPTGRGLLTLRNADASDIGLFFEWANDTENRRYSFRQEPISWSEHQSWFEQRLGASDSWLWVLCAQDGMPVGEVHIDTQDGKGLLSYTIDADYRGRGWGGKFLQLIAERWRQSAGARLLHAEVLDNNIASITCFDKSDCFRHVANTSTHRIYQIQQ